MQATNPYERHKPFYDFLLFLVLTFVALFISNFIAQVVGLFAFSGSQSELEAVLRSPTAYPQYRSLYLSMQLVQSFVVFVLLPMMFITLKEKQDIAELFERDFSKKGRLLGYVFLLVLLYMPMSAWLVHFNQNLVFPEFLSGFEHWARQKEDKLKALTEFMTDFSTYKEIALGFLVIAITAAVGEELFFRVVIQRQIYRFSGNIHVAIWVAAIIFSAFHLQFYGFLPRLFLGALFGYLYAWTGWIVVPIFAHFLNNAITLLVMINAREQLNYLEQNTQSVPFLLFVFSATSVAVLLRLIKRNSREKSSINR
jgi:membrane protease YdiL (CAAX protease family)